MIEYHLHLIKYNREANKKVIEVLEVLSEEDRMCDRKSFYKSLHGLLDHIVVSSLYLQKLIKSSCPLLSGLEGNYLNYKLERGKINFPDFSELKAALEAIDAGFEEMLNSINDEDLNKVVKLTRPDITIEYTLGVFILQYANHGIHHRGQISQILDEMGIENNFANLYPKYE
jgi:uncharacterized damage-inducible protein DinB